MTLTRSPPICAALVALGLIAGLPALAQTNSAGIVEERELRDLELMEVNERLRETELRAEELEREIATLAADRVELNRRLLEAAEAVRGYEDGIVRAEERLDALGLRQADLTSDLVDRRATLTDLLSALQRMGRNQPPAVLVRPDDALSAVRSAMLVGAVFPGVRAEADALATDLAELVSLSDEISSERERLATELRGLASEQEQVQRLIAAKQELEAEARDDLDTARDQARDLANRAANLRDLIAALDSEERRLAGPRGLSEAEIDAALRDPSRIQPAVAFSDAQERLPIPVSGPVITPFGGPDGVGGEATGITIAARSGAQVIAPADGWVVYSGPFRSYGQLLILDAGGGYHLVLAGMNTISVSLGQFVLAGEPIGQMGQMAIASAASTTVGQSQPVLYVEFRRDGRPIDPSPWWAEDQGRN
ncbi:MAG: peptidoglycan DD-metalloendopeptidase family protein [Pseudomonadota bacterium]